MVWTTAAFRVSAGGVLQLTLVEEMGEGSPVVWAVLFEIECFAFIAS